MIKGQIIARKRIVRTAKSWRTMTGSAFSNAHKCIVAVFEVFGNFFFWVVYGLVESAFEACQTIHKGFYGVIERFFCPNIRFVSLKKQCFVLFACVQFCKNCTIIIVKFLWIFDYTFKDGYNTFMGVGKCGTCHRAPTFGGSDNPFSTDYLAINYNEKKLKVPALRHVLQSFPYMHDGRAPTLSDVYTDDYHTSFVPKSLTKKQIDKINIFLTYICDNITSDNQIPKRLPELTHKQQRNIGGLY